MKTHEILLEVATIIREATSVHEMDCALVDLLRRAHAHDRRLFTLYVCFLSQLKDVIRLVLFADKPHLVEEYSRTPNPEDVTRVFFDTTRLECTEDSDPYVALIDLMDQHVKKDKLQFSLCVSNYTSMIMTIMGGGKAE